MPKVYEIHVATDDDGFSTRVYALFADGTSLLIPGTHAWRRSRERALRASIDALVDRLNLERIEEVAFRIRGR